MLKYKTSCLRMSYSITSISAVVQDRDAQILGKKLLATLNKKLKKRLDLDFCMILAPEPLDHLFT